jgi:GNAT superfamily N-acetyltransferase
MAKFVYYVPEKDYGCEQILSKGCSWKELASSFGHELQSTLEQKYGLYTCLFLEDDGVELDQGCAGMGKDWFNFRFRVFANIAVYLDMINIPYEWRHKGIGELLIEQLKKFCIDTGIKYIFLGSYEPSNPFWEGCGFVKINEYPDFVMDIDSMAK